MKNKCLLSWIVGLLAIFSLQAFAQQPGSLKWKFSMGSGTMASPAIGPDGTILLGSADHNLYTVKPDGSLKWKFLAGKSVSTASISPEGTIYVGSHDGYLYALKPDGTLKWKFKMGPWIASSPAIAQDGIIYVGSGDHNIYALNSDGSLKWKFATGNWIESSPAISQDRTIYVGSWDSYLYALNPDGSLKWKYKTGSAIQSSPAISQDGTIYVGSEDSYIYAINPDATLKWKFKTNGPAESSPSIGADGTIYVGSDDQYLYAINPDGNLKWKFLTGNLVESSPLVGQDGTIYVGSQDGYLYALTSDGKLRWKYGTEGYGIYSSPVLGTDGIIYIGSNGPYIYAIYTDSYGLANSPWPMFGHDIRHTRRASFQSQPELTITYPNAPGIVWQAGQQYTITWTSSGNVGSEVKIELYRGNSLNRTIASSTANDGSYSWTVPNDIQPGIDYRIKISSATDASIYDFSDYPFTIEIPNDEPAITIIKPSNYETADISYTIQWIDSDADDDALISLGYDTDTDINNGGYTWIAVGLHEDPDGDGDTYVWDTSSLPEGGPYYILALINDGKAQSYDYSEGTVTIQHNVSPTIRVVKPSGDETADISYTIQWTDSDADDDALISLAYDTDTDKSNGGYTWIAVELHEDPDGDGDTYVWDTSGLPEGGPYYILAVINDGKAQGYDYSEGTVTIKHYRLALESLSFKTSVSYPPQTDDAERIDIIVNIQNQETSNLERIKPECYYNGEQIDIDIDRRHDRNPRDGVIDEIKPGKDRVKIATIDNLPAVWENNQIEVRIVAIEGTPTFINRVYKLSSYYITDPEGNPFIFSEDTYDFPNDSLHIPTISELRRALAERGFNWILRWWFAKDMGGICLGMSSTAGIYFRFPTTNPISPNIHTRELDYNEWQVKKNIIHYQFWGNVYLEGEEMWNPNVISNTAISMLKNNRICILGLEKPDGKRHKRHACWAYKVILDHGDQKAYIIAYDPNYPNTGGQTVSIDLKNSTLQYRSYNKALIWHPNPLDIGLLSQKLDCLSTETIHNLYTEGKAVFGHESPARMLVVDNSGRRVGFISDSVRVNEIPGARIEVYEIGPQDSAFYFIVPKDLEYTITIRGIGEGTMHAEILKPVSENSLNRYYYSEIPVDSNWTGTINYNPTSDYGLQIDANNDGTVDSTITPETEVVTAVQEPGNVNNTKSVPDKYYLFPNYPNVE